jgi:sulfide dehydrogenase cytochrome subunit
MGRLTPLIAALVMGASGATAAAGINIEGLARTCNNCHGINGVSVGQTMPSIGGLSEAYLKQVLMQWKSGERFSASMGRLVKGYSDEELAAIAGYYAKLPWVPVAQNTDAKLLAHGKDAVERCVTCHGDTGSEPDDDVTPRLNGQWAKYMELELMKYRDDAVKMTHKKMRTNARKLDEEGLKSAPEFFASQK